MTDVPGSVKEGVRHIVPVGLGLAWKSCCAVEMETGLEFGMVDH